ncbi:helix-turn-helix domain-containing protein [Pedobacter flavus]|uniref:Helix-turn-helix transcriptional regulator n=1 Tax=Pedobacter flavus TaxID=3113906 RepID=A0ABU7H0X6_9SPHI|nr:helix-turn-helix transcriptional regulator [Pedobacter sp. VNH31]MEE1884815.1 helix-turn-helix transcriptional regulator [Pedobacter sp. VNH31]
MTTLPKTKTKFVASNIRGVREFRNYTQDYLAAKIGISQNAYSKIELGYSNINLERLFSISQILQVEPSYLISLDLKQLIETISKKEDSKG